MKLPEYSSLGEKTNFKGGLPITTKNEVDILLHEFSSKKNVIFRGVNEAKYKIYTSAQRSWLTKSLHYNSTFERLIDNLLFGLRSDELVGNYFKSLGYKYNDVLGLAMLQHYGAPSTLLDFTLNVSTALFFAIDGIEDNISDNEIGDYFSLYYIDKSECGVELPNLISVLENGQITGSKMLEDVMSQHDNLEISDSLLTDIDEYTMWCNPSNRGNGLHNFTLAYLGNPLEESPLISYRNNERLVWSNLNLIAQRGCFLMYNNPDVPLEEYMSDNSIPLHCVDIHKSLADYIKMNIHIDREDIYPNLNNRIKARYVKFLEDL